MRGEAEVEMITMTTNRPTDRPADAVLIVDASRWVLRCGDRRAFGLVQFDVVYTPLMKFDDAEIYCS
jgi:myo-inositol-1-phosphate synthase